MSSVDLRLPPGFRFHPTDEELVTHYLCRRCSGLPVFVPIIVEIDLYNYDPWQLPGKTLYGEKEWYFFSPRDRKYPNGSRPKRSAGTGYWKATGVDKPIGVPKTMGIKKALVFYTGKAPKGEKTNWIMHEYRLAGVDRSTRRKNKLRLDDWVLCRIYHKKRSTDHVSLSHTSPVPGFPALPKQEPEVFLFPSATRLEQIDSDHHHFDWSEPMPRLHTDSSSSDHVISTCDREVDSNLSRWIDAGDVSTNSFDVGLMSSMFKDPVLRDIYMYLEKPF